MNINFQIHYRAEYGQSLCVIETQESILGWTEKSPLLLTCQGTDFWQANVPISDFAGSIQYKYAIRLQDGRYIYEAGEPRTLTLKAVDKQLVVRDAWQASTYEDSFYTTAFLKSLFMRHNPAKVKAPKGNVRFSIDLPQILPTYVDDCLYCFELNVRASSILGYVGAGGLGVLIRERTGLRAYNDLGMVLLILFLVVLVIDFVNDYIRSKIS